MPPYLLVPEPLLLEPVPELGLPIPPLLGLGLLPDVPLLGLLLEGLLLEGLVLDGLVLDGLLLAPLDAPEPDFIAASHS
jgi:hypothetical protein